MRALREELAAEPPREHLDVKALVGRAPWLRLRVGEWRLIFRRLSADELERLAFDQGHGYLVERIVNRRDLDRAIALLD